MERVLLCYGDSNTYGANPTGGARHGPNVRWPGALQALLGEGCRVLEAGLPGRTTVFDDPVEEGLSGLAHLRPCLASHAPLDGLVVMLGTNDAKERFAATPRVIAKGMARLLRHAQSLDVWRAGPQVLLLCPVPVHPSYIHKASGPSLGPGCAEKTAALAEEYRAVAGELQVDFLDAGSVAAAHEADGIHLGAAAHAAIAALVAAHYRTKWAGA